MLLLWLLMDPLLIPLTRDAVDVRSMLLDRQTLYIGTKSNGLFQFDGSTCVKIENETIPKGVTAIAKHDDQLVAAGFNGFAIADPHWRFISLKDLNLGGRVLFDAKYLQGSWWFAGATGVVQWDSEYNLIVPQVGLSHPVVHAVAYWRDGLYFATRKGGLNELKSGKYKVFYPDKNCRSLLVDQHGGLWVGTSSGALYNPNNWQVYHEDKVMLPLAVDETNRILFSTNEGVMVFDGTWELVPTDFEVFCAVSPKDGIFWLGHELGVDILTLD